MIVPVQQVSVVLTYELSIYIVICINIYFPQALEDLNCNSEHSLIVHMQQVL